MNLATARTRQWQRLSRAKVRDWTKLNEHDRQTARVIAIHTDRSEQLSSLGDALTRAKALQRDKALGQLGVRDIGDTKDVDWGSLFPRTREQIESARSRHMEGTALVIHIGPTSGPALCGTTKGRVAADPSAVTLLKDRWCSRCWNRWAKTQAKA